VVGLTSSDFSQSFLEGMECGVHFLELSKEVGPKSLTFNEDLQSRPWWTPSSEKNYLLGKLFNHISSLGCRILATFGTDILSKYQSVKYVRSYHISIWCLAL